MNADKDKNRLGRTIAFLLIVGAVYGVRSISRGGLGCPLADRSCCGMDHHDAAHDEDAKPDMAKPDDAADVDDDATPPAPAAPAVKAE